MQVGILTFHRAKNFGAVMQAYALQTKIISFGVNCFILDYRCKKVENEYKIGNDFKYYKSIKGKLLYAFNLIAVISRFLKFSQFVRKFLNISSKSFSIHTITHFTEGFDFIIAGSDQVWNNNITNFDKTYFLNFLKATSLKKAYAASFGFSEPPNELRNQYVELLSGFSTISVREKQGAKLVNELIGKDVPVVLDPVFLLEKQEWEKIINPKLKTKDYILVFCIFSTETIELFAKDLSEKTGLKVIHIDDNMISNIISIQKLGIGPTEFLELLLNAKYIVTNSFHGTVFAINFNKQFFLELHTSANHTNSRMQHLLDLFQLNERLIINGKHDNIFKPIDYENVNRTLAKERENSIKFLRAMLQH